MATTAKDNPASLADSISEVYLKPKKGPKCAVTILLDSLPERDAQALLTVLDDQNVLTTRIVEWLTSHGHRIEQGTIRRHRKRALGNGCACP